jgi:transposase
VAGTSIERFNNFIQTIINSFPVGHPQRTFMWDNLNAHLSATVYNTVTFAGHRVLNRPPYMPKDGPIEYVFNHLQNELNRRIQSISDDVSFRTQVHNIITQLGPGFDATFVHCGYA